MTAEELFFGEAGTGPAGDLAHATRVACTMVGSLGMAGSLVSYEAVESGPITQGIVGKVLGNDESRRGGRDACSTRRRTRCASCSTRTGTSSSRCATRCWTRDELVGDEIMDVLREAAQREAARALLVAIGRRAATAGDDASQRRRRPLASRRVLAVTRKHHAVLYPLGVYAFDAPALLLRHGHRSAADDAARRAEGLRGAVGLPSTTWGLVRRGYPHGSGLANEQAFFPLYPLTVRVVDWVLPQGDFTAALFVSLAAGAVAAVLMWRLAAGFADAAAADRAVLVFCVFPGTIVFAWPLRRTRCSLRSCAARSALLLDQPLAGRRPVSRHWRPRPVRAGWRSSSRARSVAYAEVHGDRGRRLRAAASRGGDRGERVPPVPRCTCGSTPATRCSGSTSNGSTSVKARRGSAYRRRSPTSSATAPNTAGPRRRVRRDRDRCCSSCNCRSQQPLWATSITVIALYFALTANIACASPRLQLAAVPAFAALGTRLARSTAAACGVSASAAFAVTLIFVYGLTTNLAP